MTAFGRIEAPVERTVCQHTGQVVESAHRGPQVLKVTFVLEAVMCDHCDTYFGIPKWMDGSPFFCPLGHRNGGRDFDREVSS